jgi:hypothetical protein
MKEGHLASWWAVGSGRIVGGGCSGEEAAKYAHTLMAGDAGRGGIAESGVGR